MNSGVSVYPIYGPRSAELTPVVSSPASFGSPMASAPIRVSVTSSPVVNTNSRGQQPPLATPVSTPYRHVYVPNEQQQQQQQQQPPAHHYAQYQHHLAQQQQHSPSIASADRSREEPGRQRANTPAQQREEMERQQQQPLHLMRELPTPPPAHQHSPNQPDLSRVNAQQHLHQQLMYQQYLVRAHQQEQLARMAASYSPAPPSQHNLHPGAVGEASVDRDRVPPSNLPPHLRALAGGGEHRTTESPRQGCVAVPFSTDNQQHYHSRPGSGSAYQTMPLGLAPPSPSHQHRQMAHSYAPEELHQAVVGYRPSPPPAHLGGGPSVGGGVMLQQQQRVNPNGNNNSTGLAQPTLGCEAPSSTSLSRPPALRTPPHASQVPPQADSLVMLLQRYPIMWQGLMALKNDHAVVQMHFISGNPMVARGSLPCSPDGMALPLRIAQRMRLEQQQLEGVARKVQMEQEHCILLALPCGRDAMDVLQQSNNLRQGFITYLQLKQAAGIVNIAAPGSQQVFSVLFLIIIRQLLRISI